MSVKVMTAVFAHSRATAMTRLVLLAIADSAWDDGVAYIQVESSNPAKETIPDKANCSRATAFRSIEKLIKSGELQVVQVRRGRSFVNVYRVVVGRIADVQIDYDRLPFELPHPFGSPSPSETVGTVSLGGAQRLKSAGSGSHPEISLLSKDLDPSLDREIPGQHPSGEEEKTDLEGLLETTLRHYVPLVEKAAQVGLDRIDLADRLASTARAGAASSTPRFGFTALERRALLGRFDELRGETPTQAYARWIDEKARDVDFPLADVQAVVEAWDDVDDVERETHLEQASSIRASVLEQAAAA